MNTTDDETSGLTSPQTNMTPTTTLAKGKKGLVVLVALCMLFFYTDRLSSSSGGGAFTTTRMRGGGTTATEELSSCKGKGWACNGAPGQGNCCEGWVCDGIGFGFCDHWMH